ncbi:MAG: hypothetical protein ACK515_22215, partial [bacterium]
EEVHEIQEVNDEASDEDEEADNNEGRAAPEQGAEEDNQDDDDDEPSSFEKAVLREAVVIPAATTRSGAAFRNVAAANIMNNPIGVTEAEEKVRVRVLKTINELGCVGAGVGGGFEHTSELHVMKYDEAMASIDAAKWAKAVEEEHDRMVENQVWKAMPMEDVPPGAKILTSTWAMKKKSNGKFRARLNCRGYEQVPGIHYDEKVHRLPSCVIHYNSYRLDIDARWEHEG